MVNSLLDDVNELLRLSYGDENRLEDIKRRLEDGLTIYNSDINYLKKLVENHKDEIQENTESESTTTESESTTTESESTTTESEPLPVDDKVEELEEEKTQEKYFGGNLKKMGFGILVTAAVISVFFAIGSLEEKGWIGSDEPTKTTIKEQPKVTTPEVKPFSQMNEQELEQLAIPWNIYDMQRNPENFHGEIISINGYVFWVDNVAKGKQLLAFEVGCRNYDCEYIVVIHEGEKILERDNVQVYGEFKTLVEDTPPYYWKEKPVLKSHFLECFNCN